MVRGDHQQVGKAEPRQKVCQQAIKLFQRFGEPFHVFPVAIQHVEIHEVAKNQPPFPLLRRRRQFLHAVGIALGGDVFLDAAPVINVMNLANSEDAHFALGKNIQEHGLRRIDGVIMPPRRPHKISGNSRERPGNDAPHAVRPVQQFARDLAHAIQLRNRNYVFMRGNLKHAVARRVHDRFPSTNVFFAELLDDFRSRRRFVSDGLSADQFLELFDQLAWKSVLVNGEGLIQPDSGHFPMAGCRIFSWRPRCSFPVRTERNCRRRLEFQRRDIRQSKPHQIWNLQGPRFRDVSEGISSHVAIIRRIRQFADAHAIQDNPEDSVVRIHHSPHNTFEGTLPRLRFFVAWASTAAGISSKAFR